MSVVYRLINEDGTTTEVSSDKTVITLPPYPYIQTDPDGVPVYHAPKTHVQSKPIKRGKGVLGRLEELQESRKERQEFGEHLKQSVELQMSFDEWKAAKQLDRERVQSSIEYYTALEKDAEDMTEAEYKRWQSSFYNEETQNQIDQMRAEEALQVVKARELLSDKVILNSNSSGHRKILAAQAQSELNALNEQYDENGYPLDVPEIGDESS